MVRYLILKGLYEVEKTIGCGGFAKVKLATHVATGEKVAIKIMEKQLLGDDLPRVKIELKALQSLSHHNICKLYQVIETDTHYFIVMEYCSGGELFDHIVEKNRLSETDSRMFFRQIVSAVAYLHSFGYAHRDLKPENVLLDKYQNLKLIDFGLCARPEGGMENPLFTSCGSPTYAAPELVQGKQYLGQEVDVWAMGVLLYALLCGTLPFDDLNIDSLYKKILSGKYEEPRFMSHESRKLIRSMLQVDPKKRITVKELLSHPWITMGVLDPVEYKSEDIKTLDKDCVRVMAKFYQVDLKEMQAHLESWPYDYHTATYFLLLSKKKRGLSLRLNQSSASFKSDNVHSANEIKEKSKPVLEPLVIPKDGQAWEKTTPTLLTPKTPVFAFATPKKEDMENVFKSPAASPCIGNFLEPKKPSSIRKPQKRIRSPTMDGDFSPVPAKKATPLKTPEGRKCSSSDKTPTGTAAVVSSDTPGSARRVLGSIERSLHKVRHVLTPRKTCTSDITTQPVSLTSKDLCNVSTTQCRDPEFVISELQKALLKKGIQCNRKAFRLRGKMEPNKNQRFGGCSFELEICYLPTIGIHFDNYSAAVATPPKSILKNGPLNILNNIPSSNNNTSNNNNNGNNNGNTTTIKSTPFESSEKRKDKLGVNVQNEGSSSSSSNGYVGIRRKRLKGDSWCYKKVCEQVLALTSTEFKQIGPESAV